MILAYLKLFKLCFSTDRLCPVASLVLGHTRYVEKFILHAFIFCTKKFLLFSTLFDFIIIGKKSNISFKLTVTRYVNTYCFINERSILRDCKNNVFCDSCIYQFFTFRVYRSCTGAPHSSLPVRLNADVPGMEGGRAERGTRRRFLRS